MNNNQPPPEKQCKCHCHGKDGGKFGDYNIKPYHLKTHYCEACKRGENCIHCQHHQDEGMDWEDEFDKLFKNNSRDKIQYKQPITNYWLTPTTKIVKDYISSLLAKDRQQLKKKVEGMKMTIDEQVMEVLKNVNSIPLGYSRNLRNETIDEVLTILEGEEK